MEQDERERISRIIDFWFGDPDDETPRDERISRWFRGSAELDAQIRRQFLADHERAARGELVHWREDPWGSLALVLLLDQFPRNMFRAASRAFATDARAVAVTEAALGAGRDKKLPVDARLFLYMPLMHSEDLERQRRVVTLCEQLVAEAPEQQQALDSARQHLAIVERFGRFPHRNSILGRTSTAEEERYLAEQGQDFGQKQSSPDDEG